MLSVQIPKLFSGAKMPGNQSNQSVEHLWLHYWGDWPCSRRATNICMWVQDVWGLMVSPKPHTPNPNREPRVKHRPHNLNSVFHSSRVQKEAREGLACTAFRDSFVPGECPPKITPRRISGLGPLRPVYHTGGAGQGRQAHQLATCLP